MGFSKHKAHPFKGGSKETEWQCSKTHLKMSVMAKMSGVVFSLKRKKGESLQCVVREVVGFTMR